MRLALGKLNSVFFCGSWNSESETNALASNLRIPGIYRSVRALPSSTPRGPAFLLSLLSVSVDAPADDVSPSPALPLPRCRGTREPAASPPPAPGGDGSPGPRWLGLSANPPGAPCPTPRRQLWSQSLPVFLHETRAGQVTGSGRAACPRGRGLLRPLVEAQAPADVPILAATPTCRLAGWQGPPGCAC